MISFTERNFHETIVYHGQLLKRHRNGGGWVPVEQDKHDDSKPYVADTAYVGPFAMVAGCARVTREAHVYDRALVSGHAQMTDDARIGGTTRLGGYVHLSGGASVNVRCSVGGHLRIANISIYGEQRLEEYKKQQASRNNQ